MGTRDERRLCGALLGIVLTAAALRLVTALDGLWLDEIWSLRLAENLSSARDILTRLHTDNNHPLNTFWLHLVHGRVSDLVYRLPAWGASIATLLLAAAVARRELAPPGTDASARRAGRTAALLAAGALGFSHLLVHYGPEARGYSFALAFGLASYFAAQRGIGGRLSQWALLHWIAVELALLSHPLAVHAFAAVLVWTAVRLLRTRPLVTALVELIWWHAIPLVFSAGYWWGFVRHVKVAGGPAKPLLEILESAAAWVTGMPLAAGALALAVVTAVGLAGLLVLARRGSDAWVFYAVGIFGAPATLLAVLRPQLLFERYFLLNLALWLLLAALTAAHFWTAGRARIALAALALAFLAGNGVRSLELARLGRGDPGAAVRFVYDRTPGDVIAYATDQDQRMPIVLEYYAERLPTDKRWEHVGRRRWPRSGVPWLFHHSFERAQPEQERLRDRFGNEYVLEGTWPHAGLSGWNLFLYRRASPPT